ncbi:MAG: DUF1638 domain-containing protein [Thermodesulfobacteriota bacterium]
MVLGGQEGGLEALRERPQHDPPRVVIACRVMEPELESLKADIQGVEVRYVEQALHRVPGNMASRLQQEIDAVSSYADLVVLGYGLCSNGIVGVIAPPKGLVVPKAHDCIALFLGSLENYRRSFQERPGTYYLTPGWVKEGKDPLGILEEYTQKYGEDTARWVMEEELKHYTHIALIDSGVGDLEALRARAKANALSFEKQYEEIPGDLSYLRKLLKGPYTERDFFFIAPGERVTQQRYLEEALACASS